MDAVRSGERVVKEGTYLYDGCVECDIRIVHSPIRYGTGDDEDPPEIREDVDIDTYYVWYGSTTERGRFHAGSRGFPSVAEAMAGVKSAPGIGRTVRWRE